MLYRENLDALKSKILDTRRLWRRTIFLTGLAIVVASLIGFLFGEALIDLFLPLPSYVRILLLVTIIGFVGFLSALVNAFNSPISKGPAAEIAAYLAIP